MSREVAVFIAVLAPAAARRRSFHAPRGLLTQSGAEEAKRDKMVFIQNFLERRIAPAAKR